MTTVQWIVPLLTGLAGAFLASIPAMRRLSGRIRHSEAATLWEEGRVLREEYRRNADECRQSLARKQGVESGRP